MQTTLTLLLAFSFVAVITAAARADDVAHLPADKVAVVFAKGGSLLTGDNYTVMAARRDKGGEAEVHAKDTDVFYIIEGTAEFVTGGTVIDPKETAPGETRGSGVRGGVARTLNKGDVIVIPPNTPHWFREVRGQFLYFVVKAR